MAQNPTTSRRKTARGRLRRWPWFVLSIIVVALIGVFVLKMARGQSETTTGATTGAMTGMAVPSISFPSTSDHPIALTDYRGKKLVVYFYEGST